MKFTYLIKWEYSNESECKNEDRRKQIILNSLTYLYMHREINEQCLNINLKKKHTNLNF